MKSLGIPQIRHSSQSFIELKKDLKFGLHGIRTKTSGLKDENSRRSLG